MEESLPVDDYNSAQFLWRVRSDALHQQFIRLAALVRVVAVKQETEPVG